MASTHYYYLVPQLTYLIYGQPPPMTSEAFRQLAMPLLSEKDAALLDMLGLDPQPNNLQDEKKDISYAEKIPSCGCQFIDGWWDWERSLRLNLAKHRANKIRRSDVAIDPPDSPPEAVAAAAKAVQETPLEGEIVIDKARWNAIESMQGTDLFDRNTVFAYLLKLMILERQSAFQTETGFTEYKSLYASILEQSSARTANSYQDSRSTLSSGEIK